MLATNGVRKKTQGRPRIKTRAWLRWALILGFSLLFIILFKPVVEKVGPVGSALIAIPVALVGWNWGVGGGLFASLLAIVVNILLLVFFTDRNWLQSLLIGWPGYLMLVMVGYISGYVRNVFVERTRLLDQLRSRERYLTLINVTTKDILDPPNPEDTDYFLASHLVNLFVADYAHLVRWDPARGEAHLSTSTLPSGNPASGAEMDATESTLTDMVLQSGQVLAIENLPGCDFVVDPAISIDRSDPPQSVLCIPFLAKGDRFGAAILAYRSAHRFTPEEIEYAELAGHQVALALYSVGQERKIQKQLKETNALAKIERVLSETERVGIETVLQLIVDSAKELIPEAENAVLHLVDTERQILVPRAVAGTITATTSRLNMRLGEGIAGQVISNGEVIVVVDTLEDSRFLSQAKPAKFRSLIVAPIQTNKRCVGTISIQSDRPNAFVANESDLLGALGTQAAIAIENANLLETTRQSLKEINALYSTTRGLAASLDTAQLMKDVVDLLQENFGFYHVQIYLVDPQSDDLVAHEGSGAIGAQLKEQGYRLQKGSGIIGHVAETGEPFVSNNVDQVVFFVRSPFLPDTQTELTVPIKIDDRVVGVLDIQQTPPNLLTSRHLVLMTAVADHLAIALQKAQLYAELQFSLDQEKSMRSQLIQSERLAVVGRLLASVSHELNNPLQAIQNALFLLKDEEKLSDQGRQDMDIVLSETERMSVLIDRLRGTYRPTREEDIQDIRLNDIIEDVYALTATQIRHNSILFEFNADLKLPLIPGIPDQIRQVILNLFVNAIEAMQTGGRLIVCTQALPESDQALLTIADSGPGIDPELLPHIFEPFISGKENGTGLGLTITSDIIRRHHGEILAENNPQGGALFKVWLPIKKEG